MRAIRWTLGILFLFAILVTGHRYYNIYSSQNQFEDNQKHHKYVKETNAFPVATSQSYFPENATTPFKRSVMVLHGLTSSPAGLRTLYPELEKHKIPYHSARLLGHGIKSQHILDVVKLSDWLRDGVEAFDLLAAMSDKVDIVASSVGGAISLHVAKLRSNSPKLGKLILLAPYISVNESHDTNRWLMSTPIISNILRWTMPYVQGKAEKDSSVKVFSHRPIPVSSVEVIWKLSDLITPDLLSSIKAESIDVMLAPEDISVNLEGIKQKFRDSQVAHTIHVFKKSTHAMLEDSNKQEVLDKIIDTLKKN